MSKINAKQKGSAFERAICQWMRALGFEAETARYVNQKLDDAGVDIVTDAPYNIQCKAIERMSVSAHQLLDEMPRDKVPVIFHKRNNKGTIVSMRLSDFGDLISKKE